jgi:transposase-like protein
MRQTTRDGRRRHTPAQREKLLAAYRRSGLAQKAFAAQMGIGYSTLTSWLGKAGPSSSTGLADDPPALIRIPNLLPPAGRVAAYRLEFAGGLTVEVARGFDPEELGRLLAAARAS